MKAFEIILERRKNRKGRSDLPIDTFITKLFNAQDLLKKVNKKIYSRRLIQEARKQYLISIVTAVEVFLKDSCIELVNKDLDYRPLAKKRNKIFNLMEIEFIIKNRISFGEIIAEDCNFQDLDNIQETFSQLFGFNFFEELKKYKWWFDKKSSDGFMQINPDFYKEINKLIKLRHNFVHDINFNKSLKMPGITKLSNELVVFVHMMYYFIEELLTQKIKKPFHLKN